MRGGSRIRRRSTTIAGVLAAAALIGGMTAQGAEANVLLVCQQPGTGSCPSSASSSIQAAVDAAGPGDWVLVWPGDYKERGNPQQGAAVWIDASKEGLHLRGMDRNATIVDGTKPGAPACSPSAADQDDNGGIGLNGVDVDKASNTWVENLTACNFLSGSGNTGNAIWWNGGDGSGKIGMGAYWGNYLTATTTYFNANDPHQASYGIFTSNAGDLKVESSLNHDYAANMNDSSFYVGACQQVCNVVLNDVHAENSAIGYSGSNAGGRLIIKDSEWDNNRSGIVPNSLNNDDAPPPQDGACPGTQSLPCMTIEHNDVHDNNNPNVPGSGIASSAPVGAGIELSGGEFDVVRDNVVHHQGAWGIVVHDYPDTEQPPDTGVSSCQGAVGYGSAPACYFIAKGNVVYGNTLYDNGFFGNPTNGDLASQPAAPNPRNCFFGNTDSKASLTSDPPAIETVDGEPCNLPGVGDTGPLAAELVCSSGLLGQCPDTSAVPGAPPLADYPQQSKVELAPLTPQQTMPNPCVDVPDNAWCSDGRPAVPIP